MELRNEIRIGNWVEHNANWSYRSPAEIKPFYFQWEDRDWFALGECLISFEDISPILLTPEILVKMGFENDSFITREFYKDGDCNLKAINHYENGFLFIFTFMEAGCMLKYLHEFQDWYYWNSGKKEIPIEL
jgi:hypothetical protein